MIERHEEIWRVVLLRTVKVGTTYNFPTNRDMIMPERATSICH